MPRRLPEQSAPLSKGAAWNLLNNVEKVPCTKELPLPKETACPYDAAYEFDVVVCGCGFAGLNAAVSAREKGARVLVVDKGRPGFSGLSPWPNSFRWFDPERDDADAYRKAVMIGGDYISNLGWFDTWLRESKGIYERLKDWGLLIQYPKASEAGDYYQKEDYAGYREAFDKFDRHKKWIKVLDRYEIPFLQHTMVTEVIADGGKVRGVIGFHVPSGQVITVHAKAVILATGGGCIRPAGYPVGGNSFDGEYIAYQLGLPIAGKEFEDFHSTCSIAPGNALVDNSWSYLENIWLCGGDVTAENAENYASSKGRVMVMRRVHDSLDGVKPGDGSAIFDASKANLTRRGASCHSETDPDEVRLGRRLDPTPAPDMFGAAPGLCCHLASGVFCGLDDRTGDTGIAGLYVAGDGIHSTSPSGASYPCGVGFASCFCSMEGDHAGKAAADYAASAAPDQIPESVIAEKTEAIRAPLRLEKGFDPNWARDVLVSIMAPYWVSIVKEEAMLQAALTQVRYMREHVIPRLTARNGHDLRLCIEMKHKALASELKLLASLARKESRGTSYRADYPYRDDDNFLCYITLQKDGDGGVRVGKVPVKEDWAGDRELEYSKRYLYYFPGEPEAKGFTVEEKPRGGR